MLRALLSSVSTESEARTLASPSLDRAAAVASDALAAGGVVTLVGRCAVVYEGRAATDLAASVRQATLKPDGAALVHEGTGHRPVAWQPPGADHAVAHREEGLVVRSTRDSPEETLTVTFSTVSALTAFAAERTDREVTGTEEDVRQRVLDDPSLVEAGFRPLATERETAAGAVDVFGEDRDGRAVVLELKRGRAGPDAAGQLARYVDALERDLHADREVRGILVAPSTTRRARRLLADRGLEFVALTP